MEYHIASSSLVFMLSADSSSSKYPFVVYRGKNVPHFNFEASQNNILVAGPQSMGAAAFGI